MVAIARAAACFQRCMGSAIAVTKILGFQHNHSREKAEAVSLARTIMLNSHKLDGI